MSEKEKVEDMCDKERDTVKTCLFELLKRAAGDAATPEDIKIAPEVASLLLEII